jgi:hypothetical protein
MDSRRLRRDVRDYLRRDIVIGKALAPLRSGRGLVPILIALQ